MKVAVVSDIHANGDALDRVLGEIAAAGVERVYHLGDLAGYNAEPEKCVRWAMENAAGGVMGNHDAVACGKSGGENFNAPARVAAQWASARLSAEAGAYLERLPVQLAVEGGILLVHGSPSDPDRYLFTLDDAEEELDRLAAQEGPPVVFFGHTHVPAAIVRRRDGSTHSLPPAAFRLKEGERALLNPGSVGQPRDRDPRASFLVYDTASRAAAWQRVAYDVPACQAKVLAAGLPRFFASRLAEGT